MQGGLSLFPPHLPFPLLLGLSLLECSSPTGSAVRVNHVHSAASTLTCAVRGRGPMQSGLAIIRIFTGIMLSRDVEVRSAAGEGGWGPICPSSPKATLIFIITTIIQQGKNVGGRISQQPLKCCMYSVPTVRTGSTRSHSRTGTN